MSTRRIAVLLLGGVLLVAPATAAERKIGADGTVHGVDVEPNSGGPKAQGTALRHVRQLPGGGTLSAIVPGTDDAAIDRDPVLAIDASSGTVLLVWSRQDGAGYDLYAAAWNGSAWTAPHPLLGPDPDRVRPQARFGRCYLHVFWIKQTPTELVPQRAVFDRSSLAVLFGPETLPSDGGTQVPQAGTSGTTPEPGIGDIYFASGLPGSFPGDPGRVVVWGTRDEPVPFGYVQVLVSSGEIRGDLQSEASFVAGRFVVWFEDDSKVTYTSRRSGAWTDMRVVEIGAGYSAGDAKRAITDAIRREQTGR